MVDCESAIWSTYDYDADSDFDEDDGDKDTMDIDAALAPHTTGNSSFFPVRNY